MMFSDTKNEELDKMLGNLFPYQTQVFYMLKDMERKKRGGIFDPLLLGGKAALVCLMIEKFNLSVRNENINKSKRTRPTPENTIVFSKSLNLWKTDLERYGSHVRVLYHEGDPGGRIKFHNTDIIVSTCINFKQQKDPRLKSIKQHDWYRLVLDGDMLAEISEDEDAIDFILKLNVNKRWVVGKPEVLLGSTSSKAANFLYSLLVGSTSAEDHSLESIQEDLKDVIPGIQSLYDFGSKVVKTIPVQLTEEEKGFYFIAEHRVKEKLKDMKLSNQPLEEERVKKQQFLDLELSILRLRDMVSSIPLAVKKGNIQGSYELMEKIHTMLEEKEAICPICYSDLKFMSIVFITKDCKHIFCHLCMDNFLKDKKCPVCRADLVDDDSVFSSPFNCPDSTKADVLLKSLESKSVVISKFDRLLTWLEIFLKDKGFKVDRIHGKMEAEEILDIAQMFQNTSGKEKMVLLASFEAILGEMDISSIHQVFFMEAVKENEENAVINHITGVKGKRNDIFQGAFRLVAENVIEGKIVGLKGEVGDGFKELNMEEVEKILT